MILQAVECLTQTTVFGTHSKLEMQQVVKFIKKRER